MTTPLVIQIVSPDLNTAPGKKNPKGISTIKPTHVVFNRVEKPQTLAPISGILPPKELQRRGLFSPVEEGLLKGTLVVKKQKVIILSEKDKDQKIITVSFKGRKQPVKAQVVRVSECPDSVGENGTTYSALIEFIETQRIDSRERFDGDLPQVNNFIISPSPPKSSPPPPTDGVSDATVVLDSDFKAVSEADFRHYGGDAKLVVAVIDTGVKFNFEDHAGFDYEYINQANQHQGLYLTRGVDACRISDRAIGYCGITEYLRASSDSDAGRDRFYRGINKLRILNSLTQQQILSSSFDDNRVSLPRSRKVVGRHGTYITAIINQLVPDASVLPVKPFGCGGYGTLFDVICCLNYVLAQKRSGVPIQVVNASWVGRLDEDAIKALRPKFEQLEQLGILVIAAAGNQHQSLDETNLFPACFSSEFSNIITVTTVKRTYRLVPVGEAGPTGLSPRLQKKLLQQIRELGVSPGNGLELTPAGFTASQNYSKKFVTVGVYGGLEIDGMQNPFNSPAPIYGTSFAAAYVSSMAAKHIMENESTSMTVGDLRDAIIRRFAQSEDSLKAQVAGGKLIVLK